MTKQEAIKILKALWVSKYPEYSDDEIRKALDMAIEALQPKTSESGSLDSEMPEIETDRTTGGMIYRQDAIDAIEQLWDWETVDGITASTALKQVKSDILNLPSAQPEIIRCKDCEHSDKWYGDKSRCFLWNKDGIDVFDDGYCNYGRKENG